MKKRFVGMAVFPLIFALMLGCATGCGSASGGAAIAGADDHRFTEKTIPAGSRTLAAALTCGGEPSR